MQGLTDVANVNVNMAASIVRAVENNVSEVTRQQTGKLQQNFNVLMVLMFTPLGGATCHEMELQVCLLTARQFHTL